MSVRVDLVVRPDGRLGPPADGTVRVGASRYSVLVRGRDGRIAGPVLGWTSLEWLLRRNDVGSITLTLPAADPAIAEMTTGAGLVVRRDGRPLISGRIKTPHHTFSDSDPHPGSIEVFCPDDLGHLKARGIFPDPAVVFSQQSTTSHDTRTGPAETVVRGFVAANTGVAAGLAYRRTNLRQDADLGRGRQVTRSARFDPLFATCQELLAPDRLGMRAVQGEDGPQFQIYELADRSAEVFFSYERRNISAFDYEQSSSEGNWVGVMGSGEGTARAFVEARDQDSIDRWGWLEESFLDRRDTANPAELVAAGAEQLAQTPDSTSLTITPVESEQAAFGRDYNLGDIVGARIAHNELRLVVEQVAGKVDNDGEAIEPTLGTPGAGWPNRTLPLVLSLATQLARLQRRQ